MVYFLLFFASFSVRLPSPHVAWRSKDLDENDIASPMNNDQDLDRLDPESSTLTFPQYDFGYFFVRFKASHDMRKRLQISSQIVMASAFCFSTPTYFTHISRHSAWHAFVFVYTGSVNFSAFSGFVSLSIINDFFICGIYCTIETQKDFPFSMADLVDVVLLLLLSYL